MNAEDQIVIRSIDHQDPADRACVEGLLTEYLGEGDARSRYPWLYLDNPCGRPLTCVAWERGVPCALTSLFPRRVLVAGRERIGSIGGDGYVSPPFRRRGIAARLHRATLAGMAQHGIDFMFGHPEAINLRALLKSGSRLVGNARSHVRLLDATALARRLPLPGALHRLVSSILAPRRSTLRLETLSRPDPRVDRLFDDVRATGSAETRILPVRDAAYYHWRFHQQPERCQQAFLVLDGERAVAAAALERRGDEALVVDLLCRPELRRRALGALLYACSGVSRVWIMAHVPALRFQAALWQMGFLPRQKQPFQVMVRDDDPDRALLLDPSAWYYLWGDTDMDQVLGVRDRARGAVRESSSG